MSRSHKYRPGGGLASPGESAQKEYRTQENQAQRKKVKQLLQTEQYDILPHPKEYGNEWSSPRDGTQYWLTPDDKWMRK